MLNICTKLTIQCCSVYRAVRILGNFACPLMGTLKVQSNGHYTAIVWYGTLAVDGWHVTFGTARRALSGLLYQM